jgi:hypothetical protein
VIDEEIRALEERLLDPTAEDLALLDGDFFEHGSSGQRLDRAAVAGWLAGGGRPGYRIEDLAVRRLSDDVVLATYVAVTGDRRSLRSSVWVRRAEGWRMTFHQGTRCPPEAPSR